MISPKNVPSIEITMMTKNYVSKLWCYKKITQILSTAKWDEFANLGRKKKKKEHFDYAIQIYIWVHNLMYTNSTGL